MSRILFALPAWGGFLSYDLEAKFDAFFQKKLFAGVTAVSWDVCLCYCMRRMRNCFVKMINNKEHCIHQLLPPEKILPMKLRASNCIFSLPQCHYNLYKRSIVVRRLFEDAY